MVSHDAAAWAATCTPPRFSILVIEGGGYHAPTLLLIRRGIFFRVWPNRPLLWALGDLPQGRTPSGWTSKFETSLSAARVPTDCRSVMPRPAIIPAGSWPRRMPAELAAGYCGEPTVEAF